jgi:inner membrane protein involved in colicin E2 resistance
MVDDPERARHEKQAVTSKQQAVIFAGVLAALFGFLSVVLRLETYSLLVGSLALFAVLSITMAVTRQMDWSNGRWTTLRAAAIAGQPTQSEPS